MIIYEPASMNETNQVAELEEDAEEWAVEEEKDVIAIRAGKDAELDSMDAFGLYRIRLKSSVPKWIKTLKGRWVLVRKGDGWWRCRWVCKEFRGQDPLL